MTLEVTALDFSYGGTQVLQGAALTLKQAEVGFLLGPSGSGKTTLLRCIAGLETVDAGDIRWAGRSLSGLPPHRRPIGMLFQEPALFPHLNVWQNVAFSFRYQAMARAGWRSAAEGWLAQCHFDRDPDCAVDALSGGQRQRVALARTLAARPAVVLLDEPLTGLDRPLRSRLASDVVEILRAAEVAALWVTHDEEEAGRLADRTWRLRDGHIDAKAP